MLRPAVLLDAAMTVFEARLRLAQHGYWLDPSDAAVQQVVHDYVERLRAAAERIARRAPRVAQAASGPMAEAPSMPRSATGRTIAVSTISDGTAIVPDAAAAAAALQHPLREGRVAVRRVDGVTLFWYAFAAEQVLGRMQGHAENTALLVALDLHEWGSSPTGQVDEVTATPASARDFSGIVLRGAEFVGISEPPQRPKMASPDMPVSGSTTRGGGERAMPAPMPAPSMAPPPMVGMPMPSGSEPPSSPSAPTTSAPVEVKAYPKVEHPETVTVGVPFDFVVGLGATVMAGEVDRGPMGFVAPAGAETIAVDVQVVAEGFQAPSGWRHTLTVSVADPYSAKIAVPLIPDSQDGPITVRAITVHYAYEGVTRGSITRNLAVLWPGTVLPAPDPRGINLLATQPAAPAITMAATAAVPDVELNIAKPDGNATRGTFLVTMRNAHGVPVPDAPIAIDLGDDARTFAKQIIDKMPQMDGTDLLALQVDGEADLIARQLPNEFWQLLRDVHAKVGPSRPVTLQLNTADPYVPWELALVDPPLDPSRVGYLAAQVSMGRWILGDAAVAAPPRASVHVQSFAVMAGMYKAAESGLKKLPNAEAEVAELETSYKSRGAIKYDCTVPALSSLLTASVGGGAQVVHFAGHGQVDPTRPSDAALFLSNGTPLNPTLFRRTPLGKKHAPFMFLNACMVGTAGEMLGDYGGFPGNCLAGNFTGLIAPIWAVNDVIAKWVATEFYRQAMATPPRPVAEILRDVRQVFEDQPNASSYLAYVYYGNPFLTLS